MKSGIPQPTPPPSLIGEVKMWAGKSDKIPSDWLLCNGDNASRADYDGLFKVIKDNYGPYTDESFTLPNFQDRSPMGASNKKKGYPLSDGDPRLPDTPDKDKLKEGGSAKQTLTEDQLVPHQHILEFHAPGKDHQLVRVSEVGSSDPPYDKAEYTIFADPVYATDKLPGPIEAQALRTRKFPKREKAEPFDNLHPYFAIHYIIYAGKPAP